MDILIWAENASRQRRGSWRCWIDRAPEIYFDSGRNPYPFIGYNLGGMTSVRELAVMLEKCEFLLTTDNGIAHLAAAVGTPIVGVFGPVLPQFRLNDERYVGVTAAADSSCVGCCHKSDWNSVPPRECPIGSHECMRKITPSAIIAACEGLIREKKNS
ncbi:hypothetical protein GF402_03915 [Candidatus Fermentibacteria bacterium]|nr:hypothetical protein [Candidatus Fermentibacteria bacterium]